MEGLALAPALVKGGARTAARPEKYPTDSWIVGRSLNGGSCGTKLRLHPVAQLVDIETREIREPGIARQIREPRTTAPRRAGA